MVQLYPLPSTHWPCLQREDPGALVQIGYTAGSRSRPRINWARNIKRKLSGDAAADLTYRSSSVFALAWNAFRMQLPDEVMDDFNKYFIESGIVRMDPSGQRQEVATGEYTILDASPIMFNDVELAPPSGFFGANYTRYVQHFPSHFPAGIKLTAAQVYS